MMPKAPKHNRIKDSGKRPPNAMEAFHWIRIMSKCREVCAVSGVGIASLHHIMSLGAEGRERGYTKDRRRDHRFVVPLSWAMHQGTAGLHGRDCGSEENFKEMYNFDLVKWAIDQWEVSKAEYEKLNNELEN